MRVLRIGWLALALAGCGVFSVSDPYGNRYGDYYNPGQSYRWQLSACGQEMDRRAVPDGQRKLAMRCCMWRSGVPIDDPQDCAGPAG